MKNTILLFSLFLLLFSRLEAGEVIRISNEQELKAVANDLAASYQLISNINLTSAWNPLGTEVAPFTGAFDGNGYIISGLNVDNSAASSGGLFGVTDGAIIRNLGLNSVSVSTKANAGAVVGILNGSLLSNCFVSSSGIFAVDNAGALVGTAGRNSVIENCYATATVVVSSTRTAGGIVGLSGEARVVSCYFAGKVEAVESGANGIAGRISASTTENTPGIENCVNLAPELVVKGDQAYPAATRTHFRIADTGNSSAMLTNNYSLDETKLGRSAETMTGLTGVEAIVMSFNTPYFSDSESNVIKRWNYRKEAIAAVINAFNPMILGMQEIRKNPQLDYLDSQLSAKYSRIGVGRDNGAEGGDYSVIYYRKDALELITNGDFWMSETPDVPSFGWGAAHRRLTTWGHFRIKGTTKEILVYNTHLAHDVQKAKEESVKMMADSIARRLGPSVRTVIATGDYNENTTNLIFKPFRGLVWSSRDEAPETDKGGTVNSWNPGRTTQIIDHVFYRNAVPRSFRVITDPYLGVELMSDHYPVVARVSIPLDEEYGDDRPHGASIPDAAVTKTRQFYTTRLHWDFNTVWSITEGQDYPTLRVFKKRSYYEISDEQGLKSIANDPDGHYFLTSDISLSTNWIPLGSETVPFTGILDGNGKIIKGLKQPLATTSNSGLFAVTSEAVIKNLGIEAAVINGDADVAAITGIMKGGLIESCYVANSTIDGRERVAALAGTLTAGGTLSNCCSSAAINARASNAGGLCALISGKGSVVTTSYFSGKITTPAGVQPAAGIVAQVTDLMDVVIENCVNMAVTEKGSPLAGAAVELTKEYYSTQLGWDFSNGTWKMLTTGGYPVPGWQQTPVGVTVFGTQPKPVMKKSAEMDLTTLIIANNAGNIFQFESSTPGVTISDNGVLTLDNPETDIETVAVTASVKEGFSLITGAAISFSVTVIPDIILIEKITDFVKVVSYPFAHFKLAADLDFSRVSFNGLCSEAAPFSGIFDGDGHVIRSVTITSSGKRAAGFFNVTRGAVIRNFGLEQAAVRLTSNHKSAGGIVGLMRGGRMEKCYVANSYVEGYDHVGSVVGSVEGLNEKNDEGALITDSYGAGNEVYSRNYQAGGFSGTIMKGTVERCYFSGLVRNAKDRAVGLFGYVDNSGHSASDVVVRNCLNLATEIRSGNFTRDKLFRIIDNNERPERPMTLSNNYSLRSTILTGSDGNGNASVETTATGRNGENVYQDSDTRMSSFYSNRLMWDMTGTWQIKEGEKYPVLRVFTPSQTSIGYQPNVETTFEVSVFDNKLHLSGLGNHSAVSVYSLSGIRVAGVQTGDHELVSTLPSKGVFLVQVRDQNAIHVLKVINN